MPKRVLVVEDESMVAILIEDLVLELGFEVVGPVPSAAEAKAAAERADIDWALLDVNLGGGETSFGAADALRSRGVPFAFITGYGVAGVRPDLRDAPVLGKPLDPEALRRLFASAPPRGSRSVGQEPPG